MKKVLKQIIRKVRTMAEVEDPDELHCKRKAVATLSPTRSGKNGTDNLRCLTHSYMSQEPQRRRISCGIVPISLSIHYFLRSRPSRHRTCVALHSLAYLQGGFGPKVGSSSICSSVYRRGSLECGRHAVTDRAPMNCYHTSPSFGRG